MSWEEGKYLIKKNTPNVNEELLKITGHLEEKDAKYHLHNFLRENITFTTNLIAGVDLFPFQHLAIKSMLETTIVKSPESALYYTELDLNTENDYKMSLTLLKLTSYEREECSEYICCITCKKILQCDCVNCSAINNYYN